MEDQPAQEEGAEPGRDTARLLWDTPGQMRLPPPLFYTKAVWLDQPFFQIWQITHFLTQTQMRLKSPGISFSQTLFMRSFEFHTL